MLASVPCSLVTAGKGVKLLPEAGEILESICKVDQNGERSKLQKFDRRIMMSKNLTENVFYMFYAILQR